MNLIPERFFALAGALSAFLAVAAGAFGAHLLRGRVSAEMLAVFETGVRYHMYHALALIGVSWALSRWPVPQAVWAGWFFLAGTVIFSGSLYVLSLTGVRWWGAVTPLGGVSFLLGWVCLAWAIARP
jgi:uncharacterized membrane protein YgdD (TMEM256/DUF423 family)